MTEPQINSENYHKYYYHVIDKEEKYDQFYPKTISEENKDKLDLDHLDPDGIRIGTNYKKGTREGFGEYVKTRIKSHWYPNGDKLYFTGEEELDNKLKDLNIELYEINDQKKLKEKWDEIKEDSIFSGLKDTSNKNPHPTNRPLNFERLNETNVGKILCHIATIPTYNIFMTKMKDINKKRRERRRI